MAKIVDKIGEDELQYSLADSNALEFVSEQERTRLAKALPRTFVVGRRRDFETAHFFKEARALARLALEETRNEGSPHGAVLFRDADGTRSTERGRHQTRLRSIQDGFAAEGFDLGVPMVPKPKSEAWLICALQAHPYQNCAALEDSLSGNDNAPEPAKDQLRELLDQRGRSMDDLADLVEKGVVDPLRDEMKAMPSYEQFDTRLREVLRVMKHKSS